MNSPQSNPLTFLFSTRSNLPFLQRLRLVWHFYALVRKKKRGKIVPRQFAYLYKALGEREEIPGVLRFLLRSHPALSFSQRLSLVGRFFAISLRVECPHAQYEILHFVDALLRMPQDIAGCVVEAGCYKGGSTAKFSIAASVVNRELLVFDSFAGLPDHDERVVRPGSYQGGFDEVKKNVAKFGDLSICRFIKGWFAETMPGFSKPISAMFLDVDLSTSTRTCLKHLYPLLVPEGVLVSHDGHLPAVMEVYNDQAFWETEVGCPRPAIERIGKRLVRIVKSPIDGQKN